MSADTAERTLLLTGASRGIGHATVIKFVQEGWRVITCSRQAFSEDCPWGGKENHIQVDLSDPNQTIDAIERIKKRLKGGRLDALVNNAGIHLKKDLFHVDHTEFQEVLLTNLVSAFTLSKEVAKKMVEKSKGSIINISSMAAHYGLPKVIAYSASKAGIEGLTRALAAELSPLGIRVNCIAPGFIKTRMSSEALDKDPERKAKVLSRTPLGKLGQPEDVANLAYFLTSEETSYITGTIIPVDGGNLIGF